MVYQQNMQVKQIKGVKILKEQQNPDTTIYKDVFRKYAASAALLLHANC